MNSEIPSKHDRMPEVPPRITEQRRKMLFVRSERNGVAMHQWFMFGLFVLLAVVSYLAGYFSGRPVSSPMPNRLRMRLLVRLDDKWAFVADGDGSNRGEFIPREAIERNWTQYTNVLLCPTPLRRERPNQ